MIPRREPIPERALGNFSATTGRLDKFIVARSGDGKQERENPGHFSVDGCVVLVAGGKDRFLALDEPRGLQFVPAVFDQTPRRLSCRLKVELQA